MKEYADKIESFTIRAGFLDGAVLTATEVEALAAIPAKEVLIARMLGSLTGPIRSLAYALQGIVDKEGATEDAASTEAAEA